jgi:hypothetical protein
VCVAMKKENIGYVYKKLGILRKHCHVYEACLLPVDKMKLGS